MGFGLIARLLPVRAHRETSLVLADAAANRALFGVIAILTLLASLAAGLATGVAEAASGWESAIAGEATIQVRPIAGRDAEADLARAAAIARAHSDIAEARVMGRAETEELLAPWLGRGLDLGSLPVPRMIVLRLARHPAALDGLAARLRDVPGAALDDHWQWLQRLSTAAGTVVAVAAALVGLVLAASGLAVAFATRGMVAGSREVVEVLRIVGADSRFVARAFASHFLRLGLRAAALGGFGAALVLGLVAALPTGGSDAVLASVAPGPRGFGLIVVVALCVAAVARIASGASVKRFLRETGRS